MGGSCALGYPAEHLSFAHVCNHLNVATLGLDPRTARLMEAVQNVLRAKSNEQNA